MAMRDAAKEPHWGKITDVVTGQDMRAGLSVPVQLEGGPIGSLDLYCAAPRDWDQAEISAAQVYAALAATLLCQAVPPRSRGGWPSSCRRRWSTAPGSSGPRGW